MVQESGMWVSTENYKIIVKTFRVCAVGVATVFPVV
jgi:hypothetical protein